jgi:hypothetical protein
MCFFEAMGRMHDLRGETAEARASWERAVELVQRLSSSGDLEARRFFAQALLRLGRVGEAQPVAEDLRALGLRLPSFLTLCRDAGLPMEEVGEGQSM